MGLRFAGRRTRRPSPVRRGEPEAPRQEPQRAPAAPPAEERRPRPEIGMFSGESIISAYTWFLYGAAVLLALLSVLGTFYWLLGKAAPVDTFDGLGLIPGDIQANGKQFAVAFGIQAFLTLTQYAARQFAHHDRRWYIGYIVSLQRSCIRWPSPQLSSWAMWFLN